MKNIKPFLLGVFLTLSIAVFAQQSGIVIFKPATPKQVMVRQYIDPDISGKIQKELTRGWILKSCGFSITKTGMGQQALVVYEKY